jgi:hypothetical protein
MSTEIFAISRKNVFRLFDIDESTGRIKTKGKFEGEFLYAPYFYDLMLNGCTIQNCNADLVHEVVDCFELEEKDFQEFPELARNGYSIGDRIIFQQNDIGFYLELRKVRI